MHELSIVTSIMEQSLSICKENKAHEIKEIEIEIGSLSGIDKSSFSFVIESVKHSYGLGKCNFVMNFISNNRVCNNCQTSFSADYFLGDICKKCGSGFLVLKVNSEVKIKSILI